MIRKCRADESEKILSIINEAAQAFKDVIPADCWQEPYMTPEYLKKELAYGVAFYGYYTATPTDANISSEFRGTSPHDFSDNSKPASNEMGLRENGELIGIMSLQQFDYIALINHAYVIKASQRKGIGGQLLEFVKTVNKKPLLAGTWRDTPWSISFYQKHGFKPVDDVEKKRLLARYWIVSSAHREGTIILGDDTWFASAHSFGAKK